MNPRRRTLLRALTVLTICLGSQIGIVSVPSPTAERGCESLRRWARQYESRTPSLDDLSQFDRAQRLAIFNAIPPAARAELWREQLYRFATRADLSDEQRHFIREARAELSSAMYQPDPSRSSRREDVRGLWARISVMFPSREHQRVWFDLGFVAATGPGSAPPNLMGRLTATFRAVAQSPPCECSFEWGNIECYPGLCGGAFCSGYWGCGLEGRSECIGMCFF
jgi:hypothetical protein